MLYTIKNSRLKVEIQSAGAELHSIQTMDGTEYLWQGDPQIWDGQSPNLFPYVGRLFQETYTLDGEEYHMKIHGFAKDVEWTVDLQEENEITLRYDSCKESKKQYPYEFACFLTYRLIRNKLQIINRVENYDNRRMYFGIGGHPGFRLPLEEGLRFEDYMLEFEHPCHPTRVKFTPSCYISEQNVQYPLEEDRRIRLRHDLFDEDAVVLKNADRCVTIRSEKGSRAVKVRYPDYGHIGFWHVAHTEAPYVCVEPWSSLPAREGVVEDLSQQSDLIALDSGGRYENRWSVEICADIDAQ